MKYKIFSFFSGIGLLDLGFDSEGFSISYSNELNPAFLKAYKFSRQNMNIKEPEFGSYLGSIMDLLENPNQKKIKSLVKEAKRDNSLVGFIGGPPCPDFSVGGKNLGREGDNGKLSAAYVHLIIQQNPDFFLFENVKGLWQTKKHRQFYEELKIHLSGAGYVLTDKLLNSIEYGVPQDRERIILLGFKKEILSSSSGNILSGSFFPWEKYKLYDKKDVFSKPWPKTSPFSEDIQNPPPPGLIKELTVQYWFEKNGVEDHPNQQHHFLPRAALPRFKIIDEGDDSKKSFKRLHRWRYSPTACYGNNEVHLHPYKPRRISVSEALAVQSLPKNFLLPEDMSLSSMFKAIGNGVPFLLSKNLAKTLSFFLGGGDDATDTVRYSASHWPTSQEQSV